MGLLDWLRRRRALPVAVWLDEPSRLHALVTAVAGDVERHAHVLVVAHFKAALVLAGQQLAAAGIAFRTLERWTTADGKRLQASPGGTVTAILARALPEVPADAPRPASLPGAVSLRIVDMHVLAAENDRLQRFAASLPAKVRTMVHLSFDDPVMATSAPWVKALMAAMGLKPGEAIDSPMVSRGVRRALQKLAKRVVGTAPCDSQEEWLRRNLRP